MSFIYKILIISFIILTLSACGFHLRTPVELPSELKLIYIESDQPYAPFEQVLRRQLQESHIQLVNNPNPESATLKIISRSLTTSLISISTSTATSQYNLTFSITYQLLDRNNNIIIPASTLSSANTYSASNSQMLGASNQQDILAVSLRKNVIFLLMNRLASQEVHQLLEKDEPIKNAN
jgi:LPS-assembly lipoprotein